ncbi:MAG: NAD(P)/FAD-dependent oxidoreductase [Pseudomonadota bacterium]
MTTASVTPPRLDMVIVGAGFSGMYLIQRARASGLTLQCYEVGDGVGGTWYWNRYPGARVDIESLEYSYSFSDALQREWQWSERYAAQPELLDYANHVADRFDLRDHIQFKTRVVSAIFDERAQHWVVTTDRGDTVTARFCIFATGLISAPLDPDFEGLEDFAGETYQTGRWPKHDVDFSGKKVGVIGTGSSGIQVISEVAEQAETLFVFQRTPAYTIPLQNKPVDPAHHDRVKRGYDSIRQSELESFAGFVMVHSELAPLPTLSAIEVSEQDRMAEYEDRWESGGLCPYYTYTDVLMDEQANATLSEFAREKMRERVNDPKLADKLIPKDYPILTRRLSPETNYLETFNRDNVELVDVRDNAIERFTEKGLVVGGEEIELDVVIFATGFDVMTGAMDRIDIRGRNGQTLKQRWGDGLTSYLGMMTHGFPNLIWINGPGSPFFNPILMAEYQGDWLLSVIDQLKAKGHCCIEASNDAEDAWVKLTNDIGDMTLFPKSNNYYMGDNIPGKARRILFFFGGFPLYREHCDQAATKLAGLLVYGDGELEDAEKVAELSG